MDFAVSTFVSLKWLKWINIPIGHYQLVTSNNLLDARSRFIRRWKFSIQIALSRHSGVFVACFIWSRSFPLRIVGILLENCEKAFHAWRSLNAPIWHITKSFDSKVRCRRHYQLNINKQCLLNTLIKHTRSGMNVKNLDSKQAHCSRTFEALIENNKHEWVFRLCYGFLECIRADIAESKIVASKIIVMFDILIDLN